MHHCLQCLVSQINKVLRLVLLRHVLKILLLQQHFNALHESNVFFSFINVSNTRLQSLLSGDTRLQMQGRQVGSVSANLHMHQKYVT